MYSTAPRIQLNDAFAELKDIRTFVLKERKQREEAEQPLITTSLKIDKNTQMGIVSDVKQELRKESALKINYSAGKKTE